MIAIGYFEGTRRCGLLVFKETPDGSFMALGGFDPGPADPTVLAELSTVVDTDENTRELPGWVHPDQILGLLV